MDSSAFSMSKSSDESIQSATLDEVYKDQLRVLRELVTQKCHNFDMDLCRRWIASFARAEHGEKFSRNCLCALMKTQIEEHGRLGEPFTEEHNLHRDMDWLVHQLDATRYILTPDKLEFVHDVEAEYSPPYYCKAVLQTSEKDVSEANSKNTKANITPKRITSPHSSKTVINATQSDAEIHGKAQNLQEKTKLCELMNENTFIKENIVALRVELEDQLISSKLMELLQNNESKFVESQEIPPGESLQNNKSKLVNAVEETLLALEMENITDVKSLRLFERIFENYPNGEASLKEQLQQCDQKLHAAFEKVLQKHMEDRLLIMQQFAKERIARKTKKLRETYDRRLRVHNWAQQLQMKLMKLKCFSMMRKIFINTPHRNSESLVSALKELEDKCQHLMDEIV